MSLFDKTKNFTRAKELIKTGLYPYFKPIEENFGPEVVINGRKVLMIGSNNYLGLSIHPKVKEAAIEAIKRYGSTCSGSRYLNGTLTLHTELEEKLAEFLNKEAALVFSTGFQTNQGAIAPLVNRGEVIYCDRENHASIIDGCRLSFGDTKKFKHNDMNDLEELLVSDQDVDGKLIIVDGVFSMSGDISALSSIVSLGEKYNTGIMVDDAHGIGVLGENGRGTSEHFNVEDDVDLVMGTFSKSFASLGGVIAGREEVVHYIKHFSRAMIFSASIPPANVASVLASLEIIKKEPERRVKLLANARKMREGFKLMGFRVLEGITPIVPVFIGEEANTFHFCIELLKEGIFATPIISPAVPPDQTLIRTSYMATHTDSQLDRVLEIFGNLGKKFGLI
ncbi:MAG: pyridoxal phosphate-dependent aminotransferase family protein [Planctomycetota bacterium]